MLLCQISDLHVTRPDTLACGRVDTARALRHALAAIRRWTPRPDAIIATGDLIDTPHPSEYEVLRACLADLDIPLYLVVGNHDHREALRDAFPTHRYLRDGGEFVQYRIDLGPLTVLVLDTQDPPGAGGHLCDARLTWLDEQLAACTGRPTIIAMHHPPFETGIEFMDGYGLSAQGRAGFARVTSRYAHIERVICGHLHRSIQASVEGAPGIMASTCVSTAHQITLALASGAPGSITLEPPGFAMHLWQPGAGLRTHLAYVGPFEGPYTFEGESVS
ncbi:phosphodiesterase [Pandoraea captiosa]|uniref:Phosphodiesterase n=1 Tax=Pandoraea captiosa TaxID=2508302 RepID=A0A5E4ZMM5_9BURK|nr:phosphodiesterase [Pandoraea captiosa]VVE62579.1 phosphodiesterase [Pandoraea captiosa]